MVKDIAVTLSDFEYSTLEKLTWLNKTKEDRLRNLMKKYVEYLLREKFSNYKINIEEIQKKFDQNLNDVWGAYEETINPIEDWKPERLDHVVDILLEVNALQPGSKFRPVPEGFFRSIWKMVFNELAGLVPDMNEYSAACLTTLLLLEEFSLGTLERDELRDSTIFLNEGWMFAYATAKRRARDYMRERKKKKEISAIEQ